MSRIPDYLPTLLDGAWVTLQITLGAALLGLVCAMVAGLAGLSRSRSLRSVARVYVEFFRGTSALVQLFWLFFALPLVGFELVPKFAGILALGLNIGAYGAEVVRGAIQAVPRSQWEAGIALNFSPYQRMRLTILPQAWVGMLPPFGNLLIELLKGTALVSLITIGDLTFKAQLLRAGTGDTAVIFGLVLVMYFVMAYALGSVMRLLERRAKLSLGMTTGGRARDTLPTRMRTGEPV